MSINKRINTSSGLVDYGFSVPLMEGETEYVAHRLMQRKREKTCREQGAVTITFDQLEMNHGASGLGGKFRSYKAEWVEGVWTVANPNDPTDKLEAAEIDLLTLSLQEELHKNPYVFRSERPCVLLERGLHASSL